MPPTRAAARNTTCGRTSRIQRSSWSGRRRSTDSRGAVTTSQPSRARRRTIALPTSPRWPATQTRLLRSVKDGFMTRSGYLQDGAVVLDHFRDELLEAGAVAPAELGDRLLRVAQQQVDLGRPAVGGIERHQGLAAALADALLVDTAAFPLDAPVDLAERQLDELTHRVGLAGRQHIVVGQLLLQDPPH